MPARAHATPYGRKLLPIGHIGSHNGLMADETSPVNIATGSVLKGAVREAGKSQSEVAEAIDQSLTTIQRIFAGKRNITITQFLQIADFIGIEADDLLDRVTKRLAQMSERPDNVTSLPMKKPAEMTDEELEAIQKKAAINDEELDQDEQGHP